VFTHVDGSALNPATVSRTFERLVTEAKVPRITLHGTRHTWATLALLEGIPAKVVGSISDRRRGTRQARRSSASRLRQLQEAQRSWTLPGTERPPRRTETMWSSCRLRRLPQTAHQGLG
jgi:integrase